MIDGTTVEGQLKLKELFESRDLELDYEARKLLLDVVNEIRSSANLPLVEHPAEEWMIYLLERCWEPFILDYCNSPEARVFMTQWLLDLCQLTLDANKPSKEYSNIIRRSRFRIVRESPGDDEDDGGNEAA